MIDVRAILSYGLKAQDKELRRKGKDFLGVLSIDLPDPLEVTDEDPFPRIHGEYLYADTMAQNIYALTTVLESFARADKRNE